MKKALFILTAIAAIISSCGRNQYRIHGRVTSNNLEGIQVFLVPVGHEEPENVDSVVIHNHEFFFKGNKHWMCTIRLDRYHRDKGQNLLVATEPGDVYVTIGPDSQGGGTPLNDSLQVWKELTLAKNKSYSKFRRAGLKDKADSVNTAYKQRTWEMAMNVGGPDNMLGEFLLNMFPLPKE